MIVDNVSSLYRANDKFYQIYGCFYVRKNLNYLNKLYFLNIPTTTLVLKVTEFQFRQRNVVLFLAQNTLNFLFSAEFHSTFKCVNNDV